MGCFLSRPSGTRRFDSCSLLIFPSQLQHFLRHIQSIGFAARKDPWRREQDVDSSAAAKIQHNLTWFQVSERCRISAAKRGLHRQIGQFALLPVAVEVSRDEIPARTAGRRTAAAARASRPGNHSECRLAIFFFYNVFHVHPSPLFRERNSSVVRILSCGICSKKAAGNFRSN